MRVIAVNYHYVRPAFDHPYPGIHGITPGEFRVQLETLSRLGTFVSGSMIRSAIRGERLGHLRLYVASARTVEKPRKTHEVSRNPLPRNKLRIANSVGFRRDHTTAVYISFRVFRGRRRS